MADAKAVLTAVAVGLVAAFHVVLPALMERSYASSGDECDLGSVGSAVGGWFLGIGLVVVAVIVAATKLRARVAWVLPLPLAGYFPLAALGSFGPTLAVSPCGEPVVLAVPLLLGVATGVVTYLLGRRTA